MIHMKCQILFSLKKKSHILFILKKNQNVWNILFFPENRLDISWDNKHEMAKPIFWENQKK